MFDQERFDDLVGALVENVAMSDLMFEVKELSQLELLDKLRAYRPHLPEVFIIEVINRYRNIATSRGLP